MVEQITKIVTSTKCKPCKGSGRKNGGSCHPCNGDGNIERTIKLKKYNNIKSKKIK